MYRINIRESLSALLFLGFLVSGVTSVLCLLCEQIERLERSLLDLKQDMNKLQAAKKQADNMVSAHLVQVMDVGGLIPY